MQRPWVSLNFAISADGRITSPSRIPSGWTSSADRRRFLQLREAADALMVGRGTLEADHMTLTAPQHPLRCVISQRGKFDPKHPLFHTEGGPIHLLGTKQPPTAIPNTTRHHVALNEFLSTLHRQHGVARLHCEGGGQLVHALAALDAIDEIHLTWAGHRIFGGRDTPGITGQPGAFLPASRGFTLVDFHPHPGGGECFLTYRRVLSDTKKATSP